MQVQEQKPEEKRVYSWMEIFRMVLILALAVLLIVLIKGYFFPSTVEVSIKDGIELPSELNMSDIKFQ